MKAVLMLVESYEGSDGFESHESSGGHVLAA